VVARVIALGERNPDFFTHREIDGALGLLGDGIECSWLGTDSAEAHDPSAFDGVWVLPGSPYRSERTVYGAIEHCLTTRTPFLGTCAGFQYACVALVRRFAGIATASHAESEPGGRDLVIVPLLCSLYGETRKIRPIAGTLLSRIYGEAPFDGFHWCGYGLADEFVEVLSRSGVVVSAFADDAGAEAIELSEHPFFVATAFQPQVGNSEAGRLDPLLEAFFKAASFRTT
jgi:CTP synthase (UTP-ammonia lyase)